MDTNGADGLSAYRSGFVLHAHPGDGRASSESSARRPVTNFCPPGGGALPRLQVVTCLTALADNLVVDHGHQDQEFGYYQVSLRDVNRACAHNYRLKSPERKNKSYRALFALIYCTGTRRENL